MNKTSDVIVVGAGVIGCAVAYHLADRGLKVIVLEKDAVGTGGNSRRTAKSSRLICTMAWCEE